ncbi:ABC transporter six-transmembrane domain-containing protein [Photobacterium swingsii]|uniref:ABC transporter six-transmembrane domain-containing protein n=1 Tax=Photobacterium swingsii TaxID=680026 RepID=UPI00406785CB
MAKTSTITLSSILTNHKRQVGATWLMVIIENVLMALLPLFIGYSIDSLMTKSDAQQTHDVYVLAGLLTGLIAVSIVRRLYDTRIYGGIRIEIGLQTHAQLAQHPVATRNARLDMSRELVDFLEDELPPLLTAAIQLSVSIIILANFNQWLGVSAVAAGCIMLLIYSAFHQHFIRLNAALNTQMERQVKVLTLMPLGALRVHLEKLNSREIHLSDTEAYVYGLIFLVLFGFVITNLLLTTQVTDPSAGELFSIVTYSLEFVEAAILLPITLQTFSRLSEISQRLNVS